MKKRKFFFLNNRGNHTRDFTYIDDAVSIIWGLMKIKLKNQNEIFNISNKKMISLKKLIRLMKYENVKPKIRMRGFQKEILETHMGVIRK